MLLTCDCGFIEKSIKEINEVIKTLLCPKCNSNLRERGIAKQVKLEHFIIINNSEDTETRRKEIYNYLMSVDDATDSEIMKALGYKDRNNISPRRNELVQMALIKESCKRLCSNSNKKVTAWRTI